MLATTASRTNAPGADNAPIDDTDHTMTTGSSSPPPLRQLATQSTRHGQSKRRALSRIADEDEDEDEDMYLDSRPRGSSSRSTMHDGEDGTARQSRKRKTLVDDDSDAANDDTGSVAHRSRKPRRLIDEDNHDNHDEDEDNNNHNNYDNHDDDMAPQSRKHAATRAQYDDDISRTSKLRKAKKNTGATSTSKGKGRS